MGDFSGFAALSYDRGSVLVCNLNDGIDKFALSPFRLTKTFKHPVRDRVPLQITTPLKGAWVVIGSDDGVVRFFDPKSGQVIHCLRHSDCECNFFLLCQF